MATEAYIYVSKEGDLIVVNGVRKSIKDKFHSFPKPFQTPLSHPEVMEEVNKVAMVKYRNIKVSGSLLAKYYDESNDVFVFQGHVLSIDKENSINTTSGGM